MPDKKIKKETYEGTFSGKVKLEKKSSDPKSKTNKPRKKKITIYGKKLPINEEDFKGTL
jgi:hypothetical protein